MAAGPEIDGVFQWAVGLLAAGYGAVLTFMANQIRGLQRQIDTSTLEAERRFALKDDLHDMRKHVDSRFDRIEQSAEATRTQILNEIRERRSVHRGSP